MKERIKKIAVPAAAVIASIGIGFAGIASAQAAPSPSDGQQGQGKTERHREGGRPGFMGHAEGQRGAHGTVTAVSGNTITITDKDGKTLTVDASGATVSKVITVPVSDIKIGDTIGAHGTVSGTTITATHIMDGIMPHPEK
jgi:hypothetical protein